MPQLEPVSPATPKPPKPVQPKPAKAVQPKPMPVGPKDVPSRQLRGPRTYGSIPSQVPPDDPFTAALRPHGFEMTEEERRNRGRHARALAVMERIHLIEKESGGKLPSDMTLAMAESRLHEYDLKRAARLFARRIDTPITNLFPTVQLFGRDIFVDPRTGKPLTLRVARRSYKPYEVRFYEVALSQLGVDPSYAAQIFRALGVLRGDQLSFEQTMGMVATIAKTVPPAKFELFKHNLKLVAGSESMSEEERVTFALQATLRGVRFSSDPMDPTHPLQILLGQNPEAKKQWNKALELAQARLEGKPVVGGEVLRPSPYMPRPPTPEPVVSVQPTAGAALGSALGGGGAEVELDPAALAELPEDQQLALKLLTGTKTDYKSNYTLLAERIKAEYARNNAEFKNSLLGGALGFVGTFFDKLGDAINAGVYTSFSTIGAAAAVLSMVPQAGVGALAPRATQGMTVGDVWEEYKRRVFDAHSMLFGDNTLADQLVKDGVNPQLAFLLELGAQLTFDPLNIWGKTQHLEKMRKLISETRVGMAGPTWAARVDEALSAKHRWLGNKTISAFLLEGARKNADNVENFYEYVVGKFRNVVGTDGITPEVAEAVFRWVNTNDVLKLGRTDLQLIDDIDDILRLAMSTKFVGKGKPTIFEELLTELERSKPYRGLGKYIIPPPEWQPWMLNDDLARFVEHDLRTFLDNMATGRGKIQAIPEPGGLGTEARLAFRKAIGDTAFGAGRRYRRSTLPTLMADLERGFPKWLEQYLARAKGLFSRAEIARYRQRALSFTAPFSPKRETQFIKLLEEIQEEIIRRTARQLGVPVEAANDLIKEYRTQVRKLNEHLYGVDEGSISRVLDDLGTAEGQPLNRLRDPLVETQLPNKWLMTDPVMIRQQLLEHMGYVQRMRRIASRVLGKDAPPAVLRDFTANMIVNNQMIWLKDRFLRYWKAGVVASPRYMMRVPLFDEQLRFWADVGAWASFRARKVTAWAAKKLGVPRPTTWFDVDPAATKVVEDAIRAAGFNTTEEALDAVRLSQRTNGTLTDARLERVEPFARQVLEDTLRWHQEVGKLKDVNPEWEAHFGNGPHSPLRIRLRKMTGGSLYREPDEILQDFVGLEFTDSAILGEKMIDAWIAGEFPADVQGVVRAYMHTAYGLTESDLFESWAVEQVRKILAEMKATGKPPGTIAAEMGLTGDRLKTVQDYWKRAQKAFDEIFGEGAFLRYPEDPEIWEGLRLKALADIGEAGPEVRQAFGVDRFPDFFKWFILQMGPDPLTYSKMVEDMATKYAFRQFKLYEDTAMLGRFFDDWQMAEWAILELAGKAGRGGNAAEAILELNRIDPEMESAWHTFKEVIDRYLPRALPEQYRQYNFEQLFTANLKLREGAAAANEAERVLMKAIEDGSLDPRKVLNDALAQVYRSSAPAHEIKLEEVITKLARSVDPDITKPIRLDPRTWAEVVRAVDPTELTGFLEDAWDTMMNIADRWLDSIMPARYGIRTNFWDLYRVEEMVTDSFPRGIKTVEAKLDYLRTRLSPDQLALAREFLAGKLKGKKLEDLLGEIVEEIRLANLEALGLDLDKAIQDIEGLHGAGFTGRRRPSATAEDVGDVGATYFEDDRIIRINVDALLSEDTQFAVAGFSPEELGTDKLGLVLSHEYGHAVLDRLPPELVDEWLVTFGQIYAEKRLGGNQELLRSAWSLVHGRQRLWNEAHEMFADAYAVYLHQPLFLRDTNERVYQFFERHWDRLQKLLDAIDPDIRFVHKVRSPKDLKLGIVHPLPGELADEIAVNSGRASEVFQAREEQMRSMLQRMAKKHEASARFYSEITPDDPHYFDTLDDVLRNTMGRSGIGRIVLKGIGQGKTPEQITDEVVDWLLNDRVGKTVATRLHLRGRAAIEERAELVERMLRNWTAGDPNIAWMAYENNPNLILALRELPPEALHPVHGFAAAEAVGRPHPFAVAWDYYSKAIFEWPTNKLSRQPFFKHWYTSMKRGMVENLKQLGITPTPEMLRAIDTEARVFAIERVQKVMFDFRAQSRWGEMLGFVVPFHQPWKEAFTVWGHLLRKNWAFAERARILMKELIDHGFVERDPETGELRVPMSLFFFMAPMLTMAYGGLKDGPGFMLSAPLASFNFLFGSMFQVPTGRFAGKVPVPVPSLNPLFMYFIQKVADNDALPDSWKYSAINWAYQFGSLQSLEGFTGGLLPTYIQHFLRGLGLGGQDIVKSQADDFLRLYEAQGITPITYAKMKGISVEQAQKELAEKAMQQAQQLSLWRALMSWTFPAAPTIDFPTHELEEEYRELVEKHGWDKGRDMFLEKYPEYALITIPTTYWSRPDSTVPIPANELAERFLTAPGIEEFAKQYPQWVFAFLPQEVWTEDFDRGVFFRQLEEGWRSIRGPLELFKEADAQKGWELWREAHESWIATQDWLRAQGIDEGDPTWMRYKQQYDEYIQTINELYPGFAEDFYTFERFNLDPWVENAVDAMLRSPLFRGTEVGQALLEYRELRSSVMEKLSDLNINSLQSETAKRLGITQEYESGLKAIFDRYPGFIRAYNYFFRNDLNDVLTKGEKMIDALSPEEFQTLQSWEMQWEQLLETAQTTSDQDEAALAYLNQRDMANRAWQRWGNSSKNPLIIWWETRSPTERADYIASVSARPYSFLSTFDRTVVLGEITDAEAERYWMEIGKIDVLIAKTRNENPDVNVAPLYELRAMKAREFAAQSPIFAQQLEHANTWGWAFFKATGYTERPGREGAAWRSLQLSLLNIQQVVDRLELHGEADADPVNRALYAEFRLKLEQLVEELKTYSPAFREEWERLEKENGSDYLIDTLMPTVWFPLGG